MVTLVLVLGSMDVRHGQTLQLMTFVPTLPRISPQPSEGFRGHPNFVPAFWIWILDDPSHVPCGSMWHMASSSHEAIASSLSEPAMLTAAIVAAAVDET